ncbi:hypothetical protein OKE80_07780 [Riemerella anatipestifer]|uniref:Uncharacterized protein n=2 Tax=Riemerella anatipestifer TaxID=34085 RepID=A0AAP3AJY3_RIEAN|nr:hypothetical protein [Riemerella anatipestifer]MBT0572037.1 hypothetical protein [Riemerella anatipestifer]MCO7319213.1 hypothetical protein [Riemerella anatipestifer]MCQ4155475.1 hypothetical protein [Riemerella anatipestifer]MCQ4181441.1 hypothetical protein [Riemerella anatipestifer]MCU7567683.1 hypothetical protein [Riemerella anatipestifer]
MLKNKRNLYSIITLIFLFQLFIFSDNLMPFSWGKLKVEGLACTCPDLTVKTGKIYLRTITPDSLKRFNIDYSEIYLTENSFKKFPKNFNPSYIFDPNFIEGKVVGKRNIEGEKHWNLVFDVSNWQILNPLKDILIKFSFFLQIIIFIIYYLKNEKNIT